MIMLFVMNLLVGKSLQINYLVRITSVRPSYRLFSEQIVVRNDEANSKSITTVIDQSATKFKSGTPVNVTVTKIGYLGASVNFVDHDLKSIITEKELNYYKIKRCKSLQVGDTVQAYVERVLEDGKVHLSLRPGSTNRISEIKKQLMDMLLESSDGKIQIGERNSAKEIAIFLRGESKSDFKLAISALYKERLIIPGDFAITLADEKDVIEKKIAATAASPSTKHNDRPRTKDSNTTLFVGNLPAKATEADLSSYLDVVLDGLKLVKKIRLSTDAKTGNCRGFAFIDFSSEEFAKEAIELITQTPYRGRVLRCNLDSLVKNHDEKQKSDSVKA